MEKIIKEAIADEPELLQYYQKYIDEVNALINKFEVSKEEIKNMIIILKTIDEDIDWGS
jgi:prefoldin subunit 5